jgi:hypothetical protein
MRDLPKVVKRKIGVVKEVACTVSCSSTEFDFFEIHILRERMFVISVPGTHKIMHAGAWHKEGLLHYNRWNKNISSKKRCDVALAFRVASVSIQEKDNAMEGGKKWSNMSSNYTYLLLLSDDSRCTLT